MTGIESLSTADKQELKDNTLENKVDISGDQNKVDETTEFLQNFEGNQKEIIKASIQGIQNDTQLKNGFEYIIKSRNSADLINNLKQELEGGINLGLDEETLVLRIQSIIAENISEFKIGSVSDVEMSVNQKIQNEEQAETDKEQAETDKEQAETDKEQAETDKEQAETDKEQAETDKEQAETDKGQAEIHKERDESIQKMRDVIEERDKLISKYQNLDVNTNENSKNYKIIEEQLEKTGILTQLKESGHDDNFINNYILVQTTLAELKSNPTNYEQDDILFFDKLVKNLDNACNIPDTQLSSFNEKNISQTRTELFNADTGNESLINTKKFNKMSESHEKVYAEICSEMGDEQLVERTKDLIEELCIISQIKGLYMCMGEGVDFNLNKANEIENKDGILTLNGHIDGVDFAIRQDTTKKDRLQTSSKLSIQPDKSLLIGGNDNFVDSNFILPSQDEIFTTITETVKSSPSFENFDSQDDYLQNLQENIMGEIDNTYANTKYVHHYMKEQVKGEKIIDKTISFVEKMKGSKLDSVVTNSNTQLYGFLNLMNYNVKYSTSVEKDKFNRIMDKINRMADSAQDNSIDSELENHKDKFGKYLTGDTLLQTRNILNGSSTEGPTQYAFDLFKNYENQSDSRNNGEMYMINFDQMLNDFNIIEVHNKQKEQEKSDQNDADNILKGIENM